MNVKNEAKRVAQHCVSSRLRKLTRIITSIYNAEFAAIGITASQFNIFTALAHFQSATPAQIGKLLSLEKSSLSRNLKLMRRNGWIEVEGEARISSIRMSAKGESVYAKSIPGWERAQEKCREILGAEMAEGLRQVADMSPGR